MSKKKLSPGPQTFYQSLLELLNEVGQIELEDVSLNIGELELDMRPYISQLPSQTTPQAAVTQVTLSNLLEEKFTPPVMEYPGEVVEVVIGATKKDGGSRGNTVVIGGEKAPAYYLFENKPKNRPVISIDVFDMKIPLARPVRMHVEDVVEDPAAWAKRAVDKWNADMINLHLVSIDPLMSRTPPKEASKTVEKVLQAVKVPVAVGGCGDPATDLKVFEVIAENFAGERLLFNSVTLDMDIKKTAQVMKKFGHAVIAFTSMDIDKARELNRRLYEDLPREDIVIDTTTAALGYGLDYAFTVMERTRLAALMGDRELQHPLSSGTTNAWAAREAWMKMDEKWGGSEYRGPLWETITALTLLLTGVDYFMMMHPGAVKTVQEVISHLTGGSSLEASKPVSWIDMKAG
ncbi:MAG: CO dehydrogenase/acetyl-CoA synthase subunit delta [Candidatus Bathyarchaeia archaeon]